MRKLTTRVATAAALATLVAPTASAATGTTAEAPTVSETIATQPAEAAPDPGVVPASAGNHVVDGSASADWSHDLENEATLTSNGTYWLAASLAAEVPTAGTALAATYYRESYGPNYGGFEGAWVEACDMDANGRGVYVEGSLFNGDHFERGDSNGSQGGCGNATYGSNVYSLRVCERGSGCSWYRDWNGHRHEN
jgi:hypothetical protein